MIIKIKVKVNKNMGKNQVYVFVQNKKDWGKEIQTILKFYEKNIISKKVLKIHSYYRVTAEYPAIILSFLTTLIDVIPEKYFSSNY